MGLIATDKSRVVIGLGKTGLACARYLARRGLPFAVCDTREQPPSAEAFRAEFPQVPLYCGPLDADLLSRYSEIILSPGVAQADPAIRQAVANGVRLSGDIDLFCAEARAPIVAITGSNAKSTVTTLVGEMAKAAGVRVLVGGNLGTPVLDLLDDQAELYVLELSSFQLETTNDLRAAAATVLNISPDHLDRYDSMQGYHAAKHRIYRGCAVAVENRDDALTRPLLPKGVKKVEFGLGKPDLKQFGLIEHQGSVWLAQGLEPLIDTRELKIRGSHNQANALAALALGEAVGLPISAMLEALKLFGGLEHRCQWVADRCGLSWFNDSKGTNVGATLAALNGLGATLEGEARILLIAGGEGKGQSFDELDAPLARYGRALILIGRDGPQIARAVDAVEHHFAADMTLAVQLAARLGQPGDVVLLSPACASFDMFTGYPARGRAFVDAVEELGCD
ncbi:UDP-N-acetylmuramoyl-L-alanine--D-glutamate ligase [Marinobacterium sp. D7]|uniref:UDP-N-acetylmuramoyl-L-alanine--D-glutamate ligase n=1 Tax=Marinobacterium ramblicola TaxID=2849041 RepID=UPI001C2D5FA2|nr:UDP-N-acetylmuramoyl-L-alanine--D-glutamate ligase [Marinobacterium ramblicola]MBV1787087.1 UDP-N-acetylmuramoyl-L-alanine--D-glutamate ligase [Marinobacterium ramblicola]